MAKPNIVVVGGSYVGLKFVDTIAQVSETHNIILIEKNSHFEHIFAFPRLSVIPGFTNKAFIPYTNAFHATPPGSTSVVHGVASAILPDKVLLESGEQVPYEYLVLATGTGLLPLKSRTKTEAVTYGNTLQARVKESQNIVVVGGGASGVQMVTDAKEFYPDKKVTLIHSREQLMNRFHPRLHDIVLEKLNKAGIEVILGQRVTVPASGVFPIEPYKVELADGRSIPADVAISCIGAVPLSGALTSLSPSSIDERGFIAVKPTLQIVDERFPKVFAIGDVAATGGNKNARSGYAQASVAVENIKAMIRGEEAIHQYEPNPFGIHMSVGLWSWILFRNPATLGEEPFVELQSTEEYKGTAEGDVKFEMGCARFWASRAPGVTDYDV